MRKKTSIYILLIMALLLSACASPTPTLAPTAAPAAQAEVVQPTPPPAQEAGGAVTVTDALKRSVSFAKPPQRIVLTGKAVFMIADAIYTFPEAAQRIVATGNTTQGKGPSFIPMIDPAFDKKTLLEDAASADQIAALKPDAVILKSYLAEKVGAPIETLGIPVVYIDFETPQHYPRDLQTLGQLFQNEARAQELIAAYQNRLDKVTNTLATLKDEEKPRVLLLYYSEKDGDIAFNVPPTSWMQTQIVETAGGSAVWKDANLTQGWAKVNLEQIAAWDADQIYIIAYFNNVKEVAEKLKQSAEWKNLRAVKEGKLFAFAGDLISWDQPDTRWILGQLWMAKQLHPDKFGDLDILAEVKAFYKDMYAMDEAAVEKNILPNLMGDVQ